MAEVTTLVTPGMEEVQGVWTGEKTSDPVSTSDIRKWAIATYWPEPPPRIFWDEEYAATTKFGGIVAPEDFNPFAWPILLPGAKDAMASLPGLEMGRNVMNGGQDETYILRIRPGDVITSRIRLRDWKERQSKNLMLFSFYESEWHNQNGELVKSRVSTLIQY